MEKSDFILDYWNQQGSKHGASHVASWGDINMINLEIEAISDHLGSEMEVLDVGCANGYSTFIQAEKVKRIVGLDFAPNLISSALEVQKTHHLKNKTTFKEGDVRQLDLPDESFDIVYTTRVLINLPNWEDQKQGLSECLRVCKSGGKVILSEAFWEPLCKINALRQIAGLSPLIEHDFNRYIKESRLQELLDSLDKSFSIDDFSSIYYIGTRVLRELALESDKTQGFINPFNESILDLEKSYTIQGFGIQKAYIINK